MEKIYLTMRKARRLNENSVVIHVPLNPVIRSGQASSDFLFFFKMIILFETKKGMERKIGRLLSKVIT